MEYISNGKKNVFVGHPRKMIYVLAVIYCPVPINQHQFQIGQGSFEHLTKIVNAR